MQGPGVFLGKLVAAYEEKRLNFFSELAHLAKPRAFSAYLAPLRQLDWVVDSKQPFAGPEQVLRYLSRSTHRVAISDHRLVDVADDHVTFTWKDYRNEASVALMTPSLCAVFSSTSSPTASSVSAITASLPTALGKPSSPASGSCCLLLRSSRSCP
jgi:hypothetical protein